MALGIDIYRYQTVNDWAAVKRHSVTFIYVKGTDGGGPAIVRATSQVRGAQDAGIPVGLYHYAQLTPSPEAQADVLTAEVRRLGAIGLPPALDLEDPHQPGPAARDFTNRFLQRMFANGFQHVALYANTSMLNGIAAQNFDRDPRIVIWAAAYGANDGKRRPLTYKGRVNIHQYTSVGQVPGISGQVDLNELLTPWGDTDMGLADDTIPMWNEAQRKTIQVPAVEVIGNSHNYSAAAATTSARVEAKLDAMAGQLTNNQAMLLAAISDDDTQVTLDPEQMQLLLAGVSDATARGLFEALKAKYEPREGGE